MKSYNGLFDAMIEQAEAEAAIIEAAKRKRGRPVVARTITDARRKKKAKAVTARLVHGTWRPPKHPTHTLKEGSHKKTREIQKPRWDDEQIVHHMLMRQFRKIVFQKLYRYACGSLPDRGPHFVMKTIRRWRDGYKGKKFYVAELDIRKFYDTIDTAILEEMLARLIRDKRYLRILFLVIDTGAPGLPKGFYTSPWLSHFYLMAFDYFVVQTLKPDHYIRLVDNMWLFSTNKKRLHGMVREIEAYLSEKLHLHIKDDWQVFRFEGVSRKTGCVTGRAINAVGFVVHRDRVTLRKSILKRARAKANRMKRKRQTTRKDAGAIISYMGYFTHTDTYGYYLRWIKPKVSVQYCKRRISAIAKKALKGEKKNDSMENRTRGPGAGDAGQDQQQLRGL